LQEHYNYIRISILKNIKKATSVGDNSAETGANESGSSPDAEVAKEQRREKIKDRMKKIKGKRREKINNIKEKIETKGYSNAEEYIEDNYESIIEKLVPGRDVGKSIQLNTRAIQQLIGIIESGNVNITSSAASIGNETSISNIGEVSEQLGIEKVNGSVIIRLG